MDIKFIDYTPTPTEQKQMGIAEITYGELTLRFRINRANEGEGFYVTPAAHKVGERYVSAFEIDSKKAYTAMLDFVRDHVRHAINPHKEMPKSASAFDTEFPF